MFNIFGQARENEIALKDKSGKAVHFKFKETKVSNNLQGVSTFLNTHFNAQGGTTFKVKKKFTKDNLGFETAKIQQYYKGVKVEFSVFSAVAKEEILTSLNGKFVTVGNLNVKPKLSVEEALQSALRIINAEEYKWEKPENEEIIKSVTGDPNASYYPKGELVILDKISFSDEDGAVLAYKFDIYSTNPFQRKYYFIDANTGKLILANDIIKNATGMAATRYSGPRTIETELINAQFRLRDNTRGHGIQTFNMNNGGSYSNATDLFDNDNNWNNTEYNNTNKLNSMLDAHWGAEMTYDYFFNIHNFNSIDSTGFLLRNYVNADLTKISAQFSNSDNAFWDGNVMTYGIGTFLNPVASLDVIAHEIGHGLFQKNVCESCESSGEFGAINEGLSDIWGAMVEFYAAPEKSTYTLGEDIGTIFRSMSNPKSIGDPDTYQGEFWWTSSIDNGGVHTNNSVLNYWFYLLAEGSAKTDGVNDNGDVFNIQGIGKANAAKIIFRAETVHFMPGTIYTEARMFTIQAAEEIFGVNSPEAITTNNAWYAVGIGDLIAGQLNGDPCACYNLNTTLTLTNFTNQPVNWQVSPNLQIVSSNNTSITVKALTSSIREAGTVTATISGKIISKDIWVGKPASPSSKIFGPTSVSYGAIVNYSGSSVLGATSYKWYLPYPYDSVATVTTDPEMWGILSGGSTSNLRAIVGPNDGLVQFMGINKCGTGGAKTLSVVVGSSGGTSPGGGNIPFTFVSNNFDSQVQTYPNPVTDLLFVNLESKGESRIGLYDFSGILLYTTVAVGTKTIQIDVSYYSNGFYFLKFSGDINGTKTIIVEH